MFVLYVLYVVLNVLYVLYVVLYVVLSYSLPVLASVEVADVRAYHVLRGGGRHHLQPETHHFLKKKDEGQNPLINLSRLSNLLVDLSLVEAGPRSSPTPIPKGSALSQG